MLRPFVKWNVGDMAKKLTSLMKKHVVDTEMTDWLRSLFSTTTDNDLAIEAMVMMATMKQYFSYVISGGCGFASATLLCEAGDWQMILDRLHKFEQCGEEVATWPRMLRPVIKRFIATLYLPESTELKQFWVQAVHATGEAGSGVWMPCNGWLTAFMYWDSHGQSQSWYLHRT